MADRHQNIVAVAAKPRWRTPVLNEEVIADVTLATYPKPGDDGFDQFGGSYVLTGLS